MRKILQLKWRIIDFYCCGFNSVNINIFMYKGSRVQCLCVCADPKFDNNEVSLNCCLQLCAVLKKPYFIAINFLLIPHLFVILKFFSLQVRNSLILKLIHRNFDCILQKFSQHSSLSHANLNFMINLDLCVRFE